MENRKSKLASWLKEPIISKKADPFLSFVLAFLAALMGNAFYHSSNMSYWEFILWLVLTASLTVLVIKLIGTAWRKSNKQHNIHGK
ncbi:hypothetical protein QOZ98_001341 [Planomicrobium stackebrandtii]|uniref:Uncharacterized protein n=1 Tax=Planomicrobium stackebrandtii TaxID=253160 RepID=A0ABU0GVB3_9BACL|nr:hypothetical protein [Planomicrobium stackebrandtii]